MTAPELPPPLSAPGIHDLPREQVRGPKTQKQMRGIGQAMRYRFLADVLYAVAGIEVFGISPFAGLSAWADDLVERANEAYLGALGAQESANFANAILGSALQTNVSGGVEISESFNGQPAPDFGTNWERISEGSGAGTYGPNGTGKAAWTRSGGLSRTHFDRHVTETNGDYQAVQFLMSTLPQGTIGLDAPPFCYLRGRVSADQQSYVYARIGRTTLQVGCYRDGSHTLIAFVSVDVKPGQVWRLQCGTDNGATAKPREFVVYRNNVEVWRGDDSGSYYGEDYRGVGMAAEARSRAAATTQAIPGEVDVFAAADYIAA